ncbi:hypothetical protein [Spirosoma montaniterrae]|uniref:Uncharacterized protein n=1 Tax=Spirosoma montaniterrae TaxID=1178516 RepID=A0A1P9WYK5_9BACT|nr:hypothetical protein [Spirosoma montaniterrae]AQG80460.1 hypothetical protein AWR27_14690 [Spirosoma montaniterrae]
MNTEQLINLIQAAQTPDQIREANRLAAAYLKASEGLDSYEKQAVQRAKSDALNRFLDEVEFEQQETLRFLALNGKQYDLNEWLTPMEYARKYNLRSVNNVTNWMIRGVIPPADIVDVPELNGLRLVRDRVYKEIPQGMGS